MGSLSGWCGQHGIPDHEGCRAPMCGCWCHAHEGLDALDAIPETKIDTVDLTTDIL